MGSEEGKRKFLRMKGAAELIDDVRDATIPWYKLNTVGSEKSGLLRKLVQHPRCTILVGRGAAHTQFYGTGGHWILPKQVKTVIRRSSHKLHMLRKNQTA